MIDELLKELKEKAKELSNNHWGDDERHLIGKGIQCMYVQAENIIRSKLKIGGWIPCSERLPTKEESIKNDNRFILDDGNRRYGGLFDYEKQCFVQFDFWKGLVEDKCAIAWQPLPEAYHG